MRAGIQRPSSCFGDNESGDVFVHTVTQPRAILLGYKRIFWFNNVELLLTEAHVGVIA